MRYASYIVCKLYIINSQKVFVGKLDGKIKIWSLRRTWKNNIKAYFTEKWDK